MAEEIKVGVAGLTHGHVGGLIDSFRKVPEVKLVALSDRTKLLDGQEGFERKYRDHFEMLEKEKLDALLVTSDNVESTNIAVAALEKGIPCLVEKSMAANAADADRMLTASLSTGAILMINWPLAWDPWLYEFKKRIDAGEIGHAFHLRYRNGHFGPREIGCGPEFVEWLYDEKRNGGGAIADFGSYGAAVALFLFGMPERVYCVRGNFTKDYEVSDDHAVMLLKYPKGSAELEGTWATFGFDSGPNAVVHGSKGTLAAFGNRVEKSVAGKEKEISEPGYLLGPGPAPYFLEAIRRGQYPEGIMNPFLALKACRILDAAIESARTGCAVKP